MHAILAISVVNYHGSKNRYNGTSLELNCDCQFLMRMFNLDFQLIQWIQIIINKQIGMVYFLFLIDITIGAHKNYKEQLEKLLININENEKNLSCHNCIVVKDWQICQCILERQRLH